MPAEFTALANTLIGTLSETLGVQLTFDSDSVKWLDGYIERVRSGMDESQIHGLSNTIGAFLGECIISKLWWLMASVGGRQLGCLLR
jgi:hypothetical protein